MLKFGLFALIGIVLLVRLTSADGNGTYLATAGDLILHFPRYMEEALRLELKEEEERVTNSPDQFWFGRNTCFRDFLRIFNGMRKKKLWAFRVFDSWGKLPSGILRGDMYDLGDFDECLNINVPDQFEPRYCLARLSKDELLVPNQRDFIHNGFKSLVDAMSGYESDKPQTRIVPTPSNMLGLNFGICIPKSCTQEKVERLFKTIQKRILLNKAVVAVVPHTCQVKEDLNWNLNTGDWTVLGFIILVAVIIIASTIYDINKTKRDEEKIPILIAFSMYTNGQKLFATKRSRSDHTMDCLNGIRVFSALWVIYAHAHIMTMLAPTFNFAYVPEWASLYSSTVLLMAPFSVDTFLFLSGLLVTWSMLKLLDKTNGKANYLMIYVHRYLRLTPILAFIIIVSLSLFQKVGSGPLWFSYIAGSINCDKYWWTSLLYIQNYYNPDSICLPHTWYLSADMQLFVFAPLVSYLLYRFGYIVFAILGIFIFVCVGWTYWLYVHFDIVNQILNMTNDIQQTFILTYYPTHVRMSPWLVGVMFAYFLFKMHGKRERWHAIRVFVHWTVSAVMVGVLAYYTYELQQMEHKATPIESGIYTPFSRVLWSLFLCFVIYGCVKGYGGPVNWFLSLSFWQPLARLTYAIYLLHMPIMLLNVAASQRPVIFSGRTILFKFFGDIIAAILLSTIASLALESPIVVIEKIIFAPKKKPNLIPTIVRHENQHTHENQVTQEPTAPETSTSK